MAPLHSRRRFIREAAGSPRGSVRTTSRAVPRRRNEQALLQMGRERAQHAMRTALPVRRVLHAFVESMYSHSNGPDCSLRIVSQSRDALF